MSKRMPVAFVSHAGGPVTHVEMGMPAEEVAELVRYWRSVAELPSTPPTAVLAVSAHWEEDVPTVMTSAHPPMLYDYGGFPAEAYRIQWPAPGNPELARRVQKLLEGAGFETAADPARGFDHGTFTPLKQAYPQADVPVVQLSLKAGLDAREHLAMGRALAPLRDEGVFIVGSGDTFHNMRGFRDPRVRPSSAEFGAWLDAAVGAEPSERDALLEQWSAAPSARICHPREEHLIPLMVIAGAAGADRGQVTWNGIFMGTHQSGYHFA